MNERRPAVVFGLLHAGLALARGLGRHGAPVHGIALARCEFGMQSRYITSRWCFEDSPPAERPARVLAALASIAESSGRRPLLFPERDENVAFVLDHWDEIVAIADVPLPPDPDVTRRLRRKERLIEAADEAGVPRPATVLASDERAVRGAGLRPPFLLKPVEGQEFARHFGQKVMVAQTIDEAVADWRRAEQAGFETLVQEYIPDSHERIFSLLTYIARDGRALGSLVGRKVRQGPLRFGTSAYFQTEHDDRALELGLRLLRSSGYRGYAHVELAWDSRDGDFKLLEVNTRPPVWFGIATTPLFDLSAMAYDDLCGHPSPASVVCRADLRWAYLAKDAFVSLQMIRRRELRPADLVRDYARRKVRATFAFDDPKPAVSLVGYLRSRTPT